MPRNPIQPVHALLLILTVALLGCEVPKEAEPEPEPQPAPADEIAFTFDSARRAPRWRSDSPIEWLTTAKKAEAIAESRASGKPILCYVSRYERPATEIVEGQVFPAEGWGEAIPEYFVPWELNWWEDPALAEAITAPTQLGAPALVALMVSPDAESDELRILEIWTEQDFLLFPFPRTHFEAAPESEGMYALPDDPQAAEMAAGLAGRDWEGLRKLEPMWFRQADSGDFADGQIAMARYSLARAEGLPPEHCMLLAYDMLGGGEEVEWLEERVAGWRANAQAVSPDLVWLPNQTFSADPENPSDMSWQIDLNRNMLAASCAIALGVDFPVDTEKLFGGLYGMITLEDGKPGGGFPAYLDAFGTFNGGIEYLGRSASLPEDDLSRLLDPIMGPRDLVWVNARMLAWWIRLVKWNPELAGITLPDGQSAVDFLKDTGVLLAEALAERAGERSSMLLADRVYLLEALSEVYQLTGDVSFLDKAKEIAATFPRDTLDDWFEPSARRFMPDLAVALSHSGWLGNDENARKVAPQIIEKVVSYSFPTPGFDTDLAQLALACELEEDASIHVAVVAPLDDPKAQELLYAGLEGWDPRKVAQILDPERDSELIEWLGYVVMEDAVAFVCIDNICYPPVREAEELRKSLEEVQTDLATSRQEQKGNQE